MTALNGKHNGLHSNIHFDRVQPEIRKPELDDSGLIEKTGDLDSKSQSWSVYVNSNISESPNFHNRKGDSMSYSGYIQIPRSLFNDPHWKSMRTKYQKVFMTILLHAAWSKKKYSINGNLIEIQPGQFCTSIRNLVDLCNDGVKFKEDQVDKSLVERAVSVFTKVQFVRHELRHKKSIFTITFPGIYDNLKNITETPIETTSRHHRDINEERKEREYIKETNEIYPPVSLLSNFEKEEKQNSPSVFEPSQKNENPDFSKIWEFAIKMRAAEGYTPDKKPGITEKDLSNWLKIYEVKEIEECIRSAACATISKSYGGYINSILRDKIHQKKDNIQINNEFLKEVFKTKNCSHLENHKQYVTDNLRRTDYQKNSDPKLFQEMINVSLQMSYIVENHEENENY
jgi:hypothetical protein